MQDAKKQTKLSQELQSFEGIWKGGYHEGDPLDPLSRSGYLDLGYMSVLHATYLMCIKPYVGPDTVACEIGPGRGAWTRCLLPTKEVWCLDALSAEHNRFWEYIGPAPHVRYFQVHDFSCSMLPNNGIDYLFSFGCLCHVSFAGISEYMENLFLKLRSGAHGFIMVADYDKLNRAVQNADRLSVFRGLPLPLQRVAKYYRRLRPKQALAPKSPDPNDDPAPGRWYHAGVDRTCEMLERLSYRIIEPDMGVNHRDPVIHFTKD
jgi:hypothetical protein